MARRPWRRRAEEVDLVEAEIEDEIAAEVAAEVGAEVDAEAEAMGPTSSIGGRAFSTSALLTSF